MNGDRLQLLRDLLSEPDVTCATQVAIARRRGVRGGDFEVLAEISKAFYEPGWKMFTMDRRAEAYWQTSVLPMLMGLE